MLAAREDLVGASAWIQMPATEVMTARPIVLAALAMAAVAGVAVRASMDVPAGEAGEAVDDPTRWLADYGIPASARESEARLLRWRGPGACVAVYRVRTDEDMPDTVARFFNRSPEHSDTWIALAPHANPSAGHDALGLPVARGHAVIESDDAGVKPYETSAPLPVRSTRDYYVSPRGLGPSAPDAACRNRSWDPLEDALALGWPWLPVHRVRPGEAWPGAAVEARCNETACLTTDGMAGLRAHERVCATPPWSERFVGELEVGGDDWVAISGQWRDREDLEEIEGGTVTSRQALLSPREGRLAWARVEVLHRWSQVRREILIESVDACPGSLRAAGWAAPADVIEAAERTARAATAPASSEGSPAPER